MKLVTVKFIEKDGKLSKDYTYFTRTDDFSEYDFFKYGVSSTIYNIFHIVNSRGYDYRDSDVIITSFSDIPSNKVNSNLVEIVEFKKTGRQYIKTNTNSNKIFKDNCAVINYSNDKVKEKNNMFKNITKNLKFGRADNVRMSIYGPAFEAADHTWVAYNTSQGDYIDVSDFLLDMDNFCYMMPVAANSVAAGDFILHNDWWSRVVERDTNGRLVIEAIAKREIVTIMPIRSPFGFDFYIKLIPLMENFTGAANASNPFGMLPLMMMMKEGNSNDMLPLVMLMNGDNANAFTNNPLMLMMMMDKTNNSNDSFMKYFLMSQMMQNKNTGFGFNCPPVFGGSLNEDSDT